MNCPDCDRDIHHGDKCRGCGWTRKASTQTPNWEPPAPMREWTPPSPEEDAEIKRLIADVAAKIGGTGVSKRGAKTYQGPERCKACDLGHFSHGGIRYCLTHYGAL